MGLWRLAWENPHTRERDLGAPLPPELSEHGQGPSHRDAWVSAHSGSAAGHALRARSRREQGPECQGSRGCPALGLSVRRPAFHTEVHRHLGLGCC